MSALRRQRGGPRDLRTTANVKSVGTRTSTVTRSSPMLHEKPCANSGCAEATASLQLSQKNGAASRTEHLGGFLGDRPIDIVECVAKPDDGFGVARDLQIAGEERGISILFGVDQLQKQHELPSNCGSRFGRRIARDGPEHQRLRIWSQVKGKGQFHRIDHEVGPLMWTEPREKRRVLFGDTLDHPGQDGLHDQAGQPGRG